MKKYTYADWWKGDIHLFYSPIIFKKSEKPALGITWEGVIEKDILKIKEKQRELFELNKNTLFEKWKLHFSEGYKNSEMQREYLVDEILNCEDILFTPVIADTIDTHFMHGDSLFKINDITEIQQYINDVIKKGNPRNYDFIHSPNYPYQDKSKIPSQIYAQARWEYYQWLLAFYKKKTAAVGSTEKNYSQRQIAIAYYIMRITIDEHNYRDILKKYSQTTSSKILQKLVTKNSQIETITKNKTADTKHLNDLLAAKRLITGKKNEKALSEINRIISIFKASYESHY